jgi:disulfide bond formation protein DsbB
VRRTAPLIGAALMIWNTGLALYHSGVERGIFEGPDSCTSNGVAGMEASALLAQIRNAPLIRCDEIAWDLLGVTMPNLNVVASAVLAAIWIYTALRARRAG